MLITLRRSEGPNSVAGTTHSCNTFAEADKVLREWSATAPRESGYDKCDFVVVDEPANIDYAGCYRLAHWSREQPDLKRHILRFLSLGGAPTQYVQAYIDRQP